MLPFPPEGNCYQHMVKLVGKDDAFLVGLSEASRTLGVSEITFRHWTNTGP